MQDKEEAYAFLVGLENRLQSALPERELVRNDVSHRWKKPKADKDPLEQLHCKENLFLYHYALPEIFDHLKSIHDIDEASARRSIRCEYHKKFPHLSSANTFRSEGTLFSKQPAEKTQSVLEKWRKPDGSFPINQAFPDLCISEPSPYKIVFDAKYFDTDSSTTAERSLVEGVYEVCYYRGLSPGSFKDKPELRWQFDFGCLLAYDASERQHLKSAWSNITSKHLFWDDANVYIMIV